jgi:uncharacterized membrane protein YesL
MINARLKLIGFIFAWVGWLLLITVPLEMMGFDLTLLEAIFVSSSFGWVFKIILLLILIVMVRFATQVESYIVQHSPIIMIIKIVYAGGLLGWFVAIISILI